MNDPISLLILNLRKLICPFLDAFSHLYKRVCPSVGWSVGWSVTLELEPCKKAVFDQNYCQYQRERILCRVSGLVPLLVSTMKLNELIHGLKDVVLRYLLS